MPIMDKLHWIGGHTSPRKAFGGLVDGAMVHAISDGTWGLSDGICEILRIVGKCDLVVSTWTAGHSELRRAEKLLRAKEVRSFRLMVDPSFQDARARLVPSGARAVRRRRHPGLVEPCEILHFQRWKVRRPVPHQRKPERQQTPGEPHGRRRGRCARGIP